MTFGFTRDSALFYLGVAAVIVGYFAAAETSPDQWTFKEWCQFALVPIGWLIGKLQTSPLAHSQLGSAKITSEDTIP